jgi:hypothetical protein
VEKAFNVPQREEHDVEDWVTGFDAVPSRYEDILIVDDSMSGSEGSVSHRIQECRQAAKTPENRDP